MNKHCDWASTNGRYCLFKRWVADLKIYMPTLKVHGRTDVILDCVYDAISGLVTPPEIQCKLRVLGRVSQLPARMRGHKTYIIRYAACTFISIQSSAL